MVWFLVLLVLLFLLFLWAQRYDLPALLFGFKSRSSNRYPDLGPGAGVHSIQGLRAHMEDFYQAIGNLGDNPKHAFFGVFDGHGGHRAAEYSAQNLHRLLLKEEWEANPELALENAYQELDDSWLRYATTNNYDDGTTACVCLIHKNILHVANVGDSRAVLCHAKKAVEMSEDHKPVRQDEKKRIEALGGRIIFYGTWRVEGVLAVTRAIGDRRLKKYVSAVPDIKTRTIQDGDQFLIVASDGVWDVLSPQEACDVVTSCKENMKEAAWKLTETAFRRGSLDNITSLVIDLRYFNHGSGTS